MTVMRSKRRWINWEKEGRILREDMPIGFRALIDAFPKKDATAAQYRGALEALAALTFSTSVAVAAVPVEGRGVKGGELSRKLSRLPAPAANQGNDYVDLCLNRLPDVIGAKPASLFIRVLSDVHVVGSRQAVMKELLEDLAHLGEDIPRHELNAKFHQLVASLFGYWPKYALGYQVPGKPIVQFDTDELDDFRLTLKQQKDLKIKVEQFGRPLSAMMQKSGRVASEILSPGIHCGYRRKESLDDQPVCVLQTETCGGWQRSQS